MYQALHIHSAAAGEDGPACPGRPQPLPHRPGEARLVVRPGAVAAPRSAARCIYCHLEPGWRTFALLTGLRAAHPDARLFLVTDAPARTGVARMLAALFDGIVPEAPALTAGQAWLVAA